MRVDDRIEQISITNNNFKYKYGVFMTDDTAYVSFRGTRGVNDLVTDFNILCKCPWSYIIGGVHAGFYKLASNVKIDSFVKMLDYKKLVFCGYSLGGAVAQLVAIRVMKERSQLSNKVRVYTFGSPLVGDSVFADDCNKLSDENFCFIVDSKDSVPRLLYDIYDGFGKYIVIDGGIISTTSYKEYCASKPVDSVITPLSRAPDIISLIINAFKCHVTVNVGIQHHMVLLYKHSLNKLAKGNNCMPNFTKLMQSCEWGTPEIVKITGISRVSTSQIRMEIEGCHLDSIESLNCLGLSKVSCATRDSEHIIFTGNEKHVYTHHIKHLTFEYTSIFGSTKQRSKTLPYTAPKMAVNELQELAMSKESVRTVIQRATFSSKFGIVDDDVDFYGSLLKKLEDITKDMNLSILGVKVKGIPSASSVDEDFITFLEEIFAKFKRLKDAQLQDIFNTGRYKGVDINFSERDAIYVILSSRAYTKYKGQKRDYLELELSKDIHIIDKNVINLLLDNCPDTTLGVTSGVTEKTFAEALDENNIVEIYAATAHTKLRIMEYLSFTDVKKFYPPSIGHYLVVGATQALVATAASVAVLAVGLPLIALLFAAGVPAGFGALTAFAMNFGMKGYLYDIERDYTANLKHMSKIMGVGLSENENAWKLEKQICNKLELWGIEADTHITEENIRKKIDNVHSKKMASFVNYMRVIYMIHKLRVREMGMFNVAVIGTTKVGKSKLLSRFGFKSAPSSHRNTTVVESYKLSERCRFIDFPGCDDTKPTVRAQFETNIQLANMFIIVLEASKLNTVGEYSFILNTIMRKKDIPIIILCNKADYIIFADEGENMCSVEEFNDKIEPIKNLIDEYGRADDIQVYATCLLNRMPPNSEKYFDEYGIQTGAKVKSIIEQRLIGMGVAL